MINTHHLTVGFGKHKGELWTRVPVSYLRWLVNSEPLNGSNAHDTEPTKYRVTLSMLRSSIGL